MPFYQTLWLLYDLMNAISGTKRLATTDSSPLCGRPKVLEGLEDLGWQQPLP